MASQFLAPISRSAQAPALPSVFSTFRSLQQGMDTMLANMLRGAGQGDGSGIAQLVSAPRMDVEETEDEYCVTAELPGLSSQDVEVAVEDNLLVISGEKREEHEREAGNRRIVERATAFSPSISPSKRTDERARAASKCAARTRIPVSCRTRVPASGRPAHKMPVRDSRVARRTRQRLSPRKRRSRPKPPDPPGSAGFPRVGARRTRRIAEGERQQREHRKCAEVRKRDADPAAAIPGPVAATIPAAAFSSGLRTSSIDCSEALKIATRSTCSRPGR